MRFTIASNFARAELSSLKTAIQEGKRLMSLLSALSVSASGMSAQRARTELLVENLANSDTTRTPEGGPYRRKDAVFTSDPAATQFSSMFESEMNPGRRGRASRAGGHRYAASRKNDTFPAIPTPTRTATSRIPQMNPAEDMVDLLGASRSYQANVSAISAVKDMIQKSLDLFR